MRILLQRFITDKTGNFDILSPSTLTLRDRNLNTLETKTTVPSNLIDLEFRSTTENRDCDRNWLIMNEIANNFAWTRQLQCPPTVCNDSVKKTLCKGVLELLWENISNSAFPVAEAHKIRKNILLYKLRHGLNDSTIASVKDLSQLRSKSNTLKQQISALEEEYEDQEHNVRQKMQQLKDIKTKCSTIGTRKDILKLKHSDVSKQLKDCYDMRRVCQHLMPSTCDDMDEQRFRENLNIVADLRSTANKKEIRRKISSSLGNIGTYTLWMHLSHALSYDLCTLKKLETESDFNKLPIVGENIDIGIARACGQYICMISKRELSNAKASKYQQRLMESIELIEALSYEDVGTWLALTLEVKKLEAEQACLQNEVQILKNNIQDNSLLNFDVAQLTADIETIDVQMDEYVKDIQQSIAVLNSTESLVVGIQDKLYNEVQRIATLQADNCDPKWTNNALDIELDVFYNNVDLNALRKVMLKGDVGLYRYAICSFDKTSVTAINPQCSKIKSYFPMIHTPIYGLIECYKNAVSNIIYKRLRCSVALMEDVEHAEKLMSSQEKCNYISLELLNFSKVVCDQAQQEIERFNAILNTWRNQDVQEAMVLNETTIDDVSFKDWLQRYSLLLYMIENAK